MLQMDLLENEGFGLSDIVYQSKEKLTIKIPLGKENTEEQNCYLLPFDKNIKADADALYTYLRANQTYDICKAMEQDSGIPIADLKVDGGACANNFLMEFQANILGCNVHRPQCIETTALGAAYLAGLAVGYWQSLDDIRNNWAIDRIFKPDMEEQERAAKIKGWKKAVKCAMIWGED